MTQEATEAPRKKQKVQKAQPAPTKSFTAFSCTITGIDASQFTFSQQPEPVADAVAEPIEEPVEEPIAKSTVKPTAKPIANDKTRDYSKDPTIPFTRAYGKALRHYHALHGTRRYVQFLVVIGDRPHVLLFKRWVDTLGEFIPGGALRHDEEEEEGIKRVWNEIFHGCKDECDVSQEMEVVECVGKWYRPEHNELVYPYKSRYTKDHKEVIKTYIVQLKKGMAVKFPLGAKECVPADVYDLYDRKDPQLAAIPLQLSPFWS